MHFSCIEPFLTKTPSIESKYNREMIAVGGEAASGAASSLLDKVAPAEVAVTGSGPEKPEDDVVVKNEERNWNTSESLLNKVITTNGSVSVPQSDEQKPGEQKGVNSESEHQSNGASEATREDGGVHFKNEEKPDGWKGSFGDHTKPRISRQDNQSKFDPSVLPESDDPVEIRKQVEFYFSDSNLITDFFMLKKTDFENNLPVSIRVIHSFKRMQRFQPYEAVVAALKESDFLVVTNDEHVHRKEGLPKDKIGSSLLDSRRILENETIDRSLYAKGFGKEKPTTQLDIEAFFAPYGPINAVRLRRAQLNNFFKGSVFVEFPTKEAKDKLLGMAEKPKFNGNSLLWKSKRDYVEEKAGQMARGEGKFAAKFDKDDWKKRRQFDQGKGSRGRGAPRGFGHGSGRGHRGQRGRGRDWPYGRGGRDNSRQKRPYGDSHNLKNPEPETTSLLPVKSEFEGDEKADEAIRKLRELKQRVEEEKRARLENGDSKANADEVKKEPALGEANVQSSGQVSSKASGSAPDMSFTASDPSPVEKLISKKRRSSGVVHDEEELRAKFLKTE